MQSVIEAMKQDEKLNGLHITPTRVVQYCLTEPAVVDFLKSYGADVSKLNRSLTQIITQAERSLEVHEPVGRRLRAATRNLPPAVVVGSVDEILKRATAKSEEKFGADEPVSFQTFLFVMIDYSNNETGDTAPLVALDDSGFDISRFLQEYDAPKKGSVIEELCMNFNKMAKDGKFGAVIGRENEILLSMEILSKAKKNNVALLGEAGVGKTAIAEGLAIAIIEGKVPKQLEKAVVYYLQVGNMVAGTQFRGQFEEKMMALLKEFKDLEEAGKMPILFIDEIHSVMGAGAGSAGGLDFANIIKPALSRGELRCIGATTNAEWNKFINQDKALKRRFTQVEVIEPTRTQTIEILRGAKKFYEDKHGVTYSDEAIVRFVDLSTEFINDSAQPDKALDLMDLTGAIYKLNGETDLNDTHAENAMCRRASLTLDVVRAKKHAVEAEPLAPKIKQKLFGQDHAVDMVVKVVERSLAGLQDDNKPVGQFLFVGPTGTGKTELAKLLAENMKAKFLRIDMSEFMEPHSVSKLIGSPPGYIGFDQQGGLQKFMQKNPGPKVILLDEMEKAHPKVYELFLQVMDNARLTDSQGEEMDFKNTVLLMTSNVGAREAAESSISFSSSSNVARKIDSKAVDAAFAPEFRGRLSGVVYFNGLSSDQMVLIVRKYVKQMSESRLKSRNINLTLDEKAEKWLSQVESKTGLGARPIQNAIQKHLGDVLSQSILYGKIKKGQKDVTVTVEDDQLKFSYK